MMRYWLMKSEPDVYSIDHLEADGRSGWEGVRSFQARNMMRDQMKNGDRVLFYHSSANPPGVAGLAKVCALAHPDPTQFDEQSRYYDPKATPDDPRWMMVDVEFVEKFPELVSLQTLRETPGLQDMLVLRRGQRLSIQPVTSDEYKTVVRLGRRRSRARRAART